MDCYFTIGIVTLKIVLKTKDSVGSINLRLDTVRSHSTFWLLKMLNDAGFKIILLDSIHNFSCSPIENAFTSLKNELNNHY